MAADAIRWRSVEAIRRGAAVDSARLHRAAAIDHDDHATTMMNATTTMMSAPSEPTEEIPPLPENWPAPLDDFLRLAVNVAGLSRGERLKRIREFTANQLKARHPGATDSDVKARFLRRQREPFASAAEWLEYARAYDAWWSRERAATASRTQKNLKKPVDPVAGEGC